MVVCVWFTISICLSWTKRLSRLSLASMLSWLKRKSPKEQAAEKNKVFEIELQSTVLNKKKKQKLKLALSTSTNAPNMINVTSSSPPQREARFAPTKHDGRKRTPAPCRIAGRTRIPDFQKSLDARALQRLANSSSTGGIVVHKRRHFTNSEKRIICNFAAALKSQKKALNFLQQKNLFIQLGQLSTWMKQHCQGVFKPRHDRASHNWTLRCCCYIYMYFKFGNILLLEFFMFGNMLPPEFFKYGDLWFGKRERENYEGIAPAFISLSSGMGSSSRTKRATRLVEASFLRLRK